MPDIKVAESAESGSPYDFIFIDQDTVYLADDRHPEALGGLQKFVRNLDPQSPAFGKFQYKYTLNAGLAPTPAQALRAVTGKREGAHVVLYAITADDYPPNNLVTVTDTGCPTGAEAGCSAADTFSVLQTSPAGSLFRGVRLAPGPCAGAECLGACCMAGNTCADTDAESCPGVWRGLGTTCAQGTCPLVCPSPFADADLDKDVDTADFAVLQRCLTPSGQTISDECTCFDRPEPGFPDGNGAIDQTDLAAFVACGSGADVPADAGCADAE